MVIRFLVLIILSGREDLHYGVTARHGDKFVTSPLLPCDRYYTEMLGSRCDAIVACERNVKRSGGQWIGEQAWQQTMERERSAEREVAEPEWSGERTESAAHSPLKPNTSPTS